MRKGNLLECCILLWLCPAFIYMGGVKLEAEPRRRAPCSGSLSLTCSVSAVEPLTKVYLSWVTEKGPLCELKDGVIQLQANGSQCQNDSDSERRRHTLTLTLPHAGPRSRGTYICKLRSNLGTDHTSTIVVPPTECAGSFQHTTLQGPAREREDILVSPGPPRGLHDDQTSSTSSSRTRLHWALFCFVGLMLSLG